MSSKIFNNSKFEDDDFKLVLDDEDFSQGQEHCLQGSCHCPWDLASCHLHDNYDAVFLCLVAQARTSCNINDRL